MLTENEILSRHKEALGEAHRACQLLGKNADPEYLAPRGHLYGNLKRALDALEGSARQMNYHREDTRWLPLGIFYAKVRQKAQTAFVGQRWKWFKEALAIFELGERRLVELRDAKTGKRGPILPTGRTDWLIMPEHKVPRPPGPPRRLVN